MVGLGIWFPYQPTGFLRETSVGLGLAKEHPSPFWGQKLQCRLGPCRTPLSRQPGWWVGSPVSGLLCPFLVSLRENPRSYMSGRKDRPKAQRAQANRGACSAQEPEHEGLCRPDCSRAGLGSRAGAVKATPGPPDLYKAWNTMRKEHEQARER